MVGRHMKHNLFVEIGEDEWWVTSCRALSCAIDKQVYFTTNHSTKNNIDET